MKKPIGHLRANAIAYLALFVALGGTGYAAISIPRNSVGTRQLRNGAVTANKLANGSVSGSKLNTRSIAGTIVFWAKINQDGQVISSSEPASTSAWSSGAGSVVFRAQVSQRCFALANVIPVATGFVSPLTFPSIGGQAKVQVFMTPTGITQGGGPLPVGLAVICPS